MKKTFLLIALFILLLQNGNAQTEKLIRYLPQNANMIMSFNPVKIASYIPGETFKQSAMYRQMMKDDNGELRAFLSDPSVSGIDFTASLILTTITDTTDTHRGDDATISIFGLLKNEALFSLAVQKISKDEERKIQTYGTNKILMTGRTGPAIAWNDEIFVFTTGNRAAMKKEISNQFNVVEEVMADSVAVMPDTIPVMKEPEFDLEKIYEKFNKQLRNYCFELLTPKNSNIFISNSHFTSLLQEKGDIKFWSNNGGWASSLKKLPSDVRRIFSKLNLSTGTDRTGVLNFENGKITSTGKNYLSAEQDAIYKKYSQPAINTSLVHKLPAMASPIMMITGTVQPEMMKEIFKTTGLNNMLDEQREKIPFNPSLISSSFGTSGLFAVVSVPVKEKPTPAADEYRSKKDEIFKGLHIIMAMPVKYITSLNELNDSIQTLIAKMKEKNKEEEEVVEDDGESRGQKGLGILKGIKPSYKYNDSFFVFSTSEELATAYINNHSTTETPAFLNAQSGYSMAMNFGLKNFINLMYKNAGSPSSAEDVEMLQLFNMFGDMNIYSGKYENGIVTNTFDMQIGKADENSLKQIFELLNKAAEAKAKEREEWMNDEKKMEIQEETKQDVEVEMPPPPPPPAKPKVNRAPVKRTKIK